MILQFFRLQNYGFFRNSYYENEKYISFVQRINLPEKCIYLNGCLSID